MTRFIRFTIASQTFAEKWEQELGTIFLDLLEEMSFVFRENLIENSINDGFDENNSFPSNVEIFRA